jgi:hypothetical protein
VLPAKRWQFDDPVLLYLYPATYVLHLIEEWAASAPIAHWAMRADRPLDAATFVAANALGLVLMSTGVRLVQRSTAFHWVVPALATAVALNTAGHMVGSVMLGGYSAGLVMAIIFWIPLGLLSLLRIWDQSSRRTLAAGIACGMAIELVVALTLPAVSAAK